MVIEEISGKPFSLIMLDCASHPRHSEIEGDRFKIREFYASKGIACFDSASQAFSVLRRGADYYHHREQRRTDIVIKLKGFRLGASIEIAVYPINKGARRHGW